MNYFKNSILWIVIFITNISWAAVNYNLGLVSQVENITESNSNANFGVSDVWGLLCPGLSCRKPDGRN